MKGRDKRRRAKAKASLALTEGRQRRRAAKLAKETKVKEGK
jgi:hypothetical protein